MKKKNVFFRQSDMMLLQIIYCKLRSSCQPDIDHIVCHSLFSLTYQEFFKVVVETFFLKGF